MLSRRTVSTLLLLFALVVSAFAGFTAPAGAAHGEENGNYTVDLPFDSDHYPRGKNPGGPYNASINHFSAGTQKSYDAVGAPDGIENLSYIIVSSPDVDFSHCSSENTAAFGIDRDNDEPGTKTDISLLRYLEQSTFNDHSIVVDFYEGNELAAPTQQDKGGKSAGREDGDGNPELYPDDEIVSHQGYKSAGGPCYGMPVEPGWYQMNGFANGTSWSGKHVELNPTSHYFYICVCDSEQEAREKLGPPPSAQSSSSEQTATATATATPTPTATATATETATQTATPTPKRQTATKTAAPKGGGDDGGSDDSGSSGASGDGQASDASGDSGASAQVQPSTSVPTTPTLADGPGFGAALALVSLAGAALLSLRRTRD